jgi:hypothetical protein
MLVLYGALLFLIGAAFFIADQCCGSMLVPFRLLNLEPLSAPRLTIRRQYPRMTRGPHSLSLPAALTDI